MFKPNFDCNYTFPTDLAANRIQFNSKSTGEVQLQFKFGMDEQDSRNISPYVEADNNC